MYLTTCLKNPVLVAIAVMLVFGFVSVYIGKTRKQPWHAAFILGVILGPLGCLMVFFQKKPFTQQEEADIAKIFSGSNPQQYFSAERIEDIKNEVEFNIKVLLLGQYIIPLGIVCVGVIRLWGMERIKPGGLMIGMLLILLATINCIFSGYGINFISRLSGRSRPLSFFAGTQFDIYGLFHSLAPRRFVRMGKELLSKLPR